MSSISYKSMLSAVMLLFAALFVGIMMCLRSQSSNPQPMGQSVDFSKYSKPPMHEPVDSNSDSKPIINPVLNLSDSLFCPLRHSIDRQKYGPMIRDIGEMQFGTPCDENTGNDDIQYFIFEDHPNSWGIFSTWDAHHIPAVS